MSIVTSSSNQTSLDQIHEFNQAVSSNSGSVSSETYPNLRLSCASAVLGMANPVAQNGLVAPSLDQLRSKSVNVIARSSSEAGFKGLTVENLMHALPSGIVILDSYGRIKHSNPAAVQMLGALRQGQYWRELIAEKFEPRVDDGHEVSLQNGLKVNLSTRSLENESGQLIVINDLTETRKLQTQLSRHQRLSSMGKMMSSLAHQIRTPLSAALLHADNLMRRNKQHKAIDNSSRKIISRLRNIERQIRDMLIFAKGETTPISKVSTTVLVEHMHESAVDLAAYYGGTLNWLDRSDGAMLNCNLDALIGAFLNLLENAFQASEKNALVKVSVNVVGADSERQESMLCIEIADQGMGIKDGVLKSLEEPFSTTKANGNGLGLAIVRLVCESHGGKFSLSTNSNEKGATAKVLLPVSFTGAEQ
ncbi:MAG TPA: PAS domain-containing sensor histidine kinase [Gammaproteobacteria bacterium]|nr:PAS domain-containing sensor histidine kinase [Gammaproteobacteria bacterium]